MGLIAGVVDKRGGRYTAAYLRERAASYPLYAGPHLECCIDQAGSDRAHLLRVTTASATVKPVSLATVAGHFMSIGYYRSQRDASVLSTRVTAQVADGTFMPDLAGLLSLEGEYAAVWYEAQSGAIHLVTDRFGARPFFIYDGEDATVFSSDIAFIRHLCMMPFDLDPLGIFQLFCLEHTLGEATNLRRVTKIPPASHVVIANGRIERRPYWHLEHRPRDDLANPERSAQVFEAMRDGSRWRAGLFPAASKALSLSGGLDSRFIAASLDSPEQFTAFTIGHSESREVQVAHQVATALGMRHSAFVLEDTPLSGIVERLFTLTGGLLPLQHPATTLQLNDTLVARRHGVVFGGGPGDVLAGSYIPHAGSLTASIDQAVTEYAAGRLQDLPALSHVFRRDVYAEYAPKCRESLLASLHAVRGTQAAHRITAWAMVVRQPSFTFLGPGVHSDALVDVSPHLDYRYTDLMLQLPVGHLYGKNFYKFMLHRELPELRGIVYANTGELLTGVFERPRIWRYWAGRVARESLAFVPPLRHSAATVYRRLRRLLRPPPPVAAYSIFRYLVQDAELMNTVRDTLTENAQLAALLDTNAAVDFVEQRGATAIQDEARAAKLLGNLLTLCYTVRAQTQSA